MKSPTEKCVKSKKINSIWLQYLPVLPQGLELSQQHPWDSLTSEFSNFSSELRSGDEFARLALRRAPVCRQRGIGSFWQSSLTRKWLHAPQVVIWRMNQWCLPKQHLLFFLLFSLETAFCAGKSGFPRDRKQSKVTNNWKFLSFSFCGQ